MTVNLSPAAGAAAQFFTDNGVPLAGGLIYTYAAGTTTPQAAYTSSTGGTAWSNPIVLNSAGRVSGGGEIWLTGNLAYKFVLYDSTNVLIATYDQIRGVGDTTELLAFEALLAGSTGSSLVGYTQGGTGAATTTVQAKLRQMVSVMDFGAVGNGTTDDTVAIQAAITATPEGGTLIFPTPTSCYLFSSLTISKAIQIIGNGFHSQTNGFFGDANWGIANGQQTGTVLRSTVSAGNYAFVIASATTDISVRFQNFALIGPGTGSCNGLNIGETGLSPLRIVFDNILIANFVNGINWAGSYEAEARSLNLIGNSNAGILFPSTNIVSDIHFYRSQFQNSAYGVQLIRGSGISFNGCVFQNNTTAGLNIAPNASGAVESITVEGQTWFENVGGLDLQIDTSSGTASFININNSRSSTTNGISLIGAGIVNYLTFNNVSASGSTLTIPSAYLNVIIQNSAFTSITDNSKQALSIQGSTSSRILGWIRFNGTAETISATNNMTLTKNSTGSYALGFTNQPYNTNYTATASCLMTGIGPLLVELYSLATTGMTCRVQTPAGVLTDTSQIYVIAIGNF
jgi:hypothetical protein